MKKILTNNIGLKLLSILGAIILWIIVVNVDDPVITRLYTGVPVEIVNASAITGEGKTFEVVDGTDTISVAISAERSIIEALSKDNIKATADLKNITFMNTVPIEVRTTRFSEKIGNISSRTPNLSVIIEERRDRQLKLTINAEGKVGDGYIPGDITPVVDVVKVSGPESKVALVKSAELIVDYADMTESFTTSCPVILYDEDDEIIDDPAIIVSKKEVRTSVDILETKEIPVTAYYVGVPASGFSATGTVICDPSSVVVAGRGSAFDKLSSIKIPDDILSVDGAAENTISTVNINDYLPKGVVLADSSFNGEINILAVIEKHENLVVELPVRNITVVNLPEGYSAHVVYGEDAVHMEVSGLPVAIEALLQSEITAQIDATTLSARVSDNDEHQVTEGIHVGANDGQVLLTLPAGMTQVTNMTMEVVINHNGDSDKTED